MSLVLISLKRFWSPTFLSIPHGKRKALMCQAIKVLQYLMQALELRACSSGFRGGKSIKAAISGVAKPFPEKISYVIL